MSCTIGYTLLACPNASVHNRCLLCSTKLLGCKRYSTVMNDAPAVTVNRWTIGSFCEKQQYHCSNEFKRAGRPKETPHCPHTLVAENNTTLPLDRPVIRFTLAWGLAVLHPADHRWPFCFSEPPFPFYYVTIDRQKKQNEPFSCKILSVPSCHTSRMKHEGWGTARLPKPRQEKSRCRCRAGFADLPPLLVDRNPYLEKKTLSAPNCHATPRKHEGWDTASLSRQWKSEGRGRVRTTDL
ncbi:hypothetical protein T265_06355 [Opisthorchis viverrini]|uniref:Uncharacterized protein n=1 Tax=Opisthorchis viverrini TaxID=6198 RepID=A0A074ZGF5_OPIVI|nr:hypothetical protein T265_06355 [Opisthorchis viverrini]KER26371.1 hypothetical protein T265_06355 [Opisthorchis viverrini]